MNRSADLYESLIASGLRDSDVSIRERATDDRDECSHAFLSDDPRSGCLVSRPRPGLVMFPNASPSGSCAVCCPDGGIAGRIVARQLDDSHVGIRKMHTA